ncbi:hypothetical protein FB567DRAFT_536558 [Paraphoma chrysanthemicola]|uniref:LPXTG-domain-containing protein n=1 Tax=Paraphoma chrysanthemicola TaxID=798071 RepID=A0A8K0QVW7_9PLEO|nr:hypothetical protein FB567DRAFT_536558 [Paraphoma chrysanthemicola]
MRSRIRYTATSLLVFLSTISSALEVSPDSPCAPKCIDDPRTGNASDVASSLTFNRDLFCYDWEVVGNNATQSGQKFKDCNNCMKSSGYAWTTAVERDTNWFLFNNRAVVDWCLFGRFAEEENKNISQSSIYKTCNNKCSQIYDAADYNIKQRPDSYSFCDYSGNFTTDAQSCLTCLYETPGLTILGNVLTTVVDLCKKKPGKVYDVPKDQEIYAATKIALAASSASASGSASPSSSNTPSTSSQSAGLSKGAIAGIVLGALVGIAVILGAVLFLLRRKKNKNKNMAMPVAHEVAGSGSYQYDPVHQSGKGQYAYQQPAEVEQAHRPAELGGQSTPNELPTGRL